MVAKTKTTKREKEEKRKENKRKQRHKTNIKTFGRVMRVEKRLEQLSSPPHTLPPSSISTTMASRWLHVTRLPHSSRAATRLQTRSLLLWTQAQSGGLAVPQLLSSHSILSLTGPLSHQATWTSFSPPPPVLQRPYTAQSLPHVLSAAPQQQAELARGLLESFRQSGSRSSHSEHRRALRSLRYLLYTLLAGIGGYELLFGNAIDVPSFLNPEGGWRGGDGDNEWEPKGPRSSKEGWIPGVWTRGLFRSALDCSWISRGSHPPLTHHPFRFLWSGLWLAQQCPADHRAPPRLQCRHFRSRSDPGSQSLDARDAGVLAVQCPDDEAFLDSVHIV